jgi:hypothetical protein
MNNFSLRRVVAGLEHGIMTISGPALAISGILAGIDLLTGGHLLSQATWLTYAWAITLMLTLDFTVLILGVHARRSYAEKRGWVKLGEIVLAVLVAAAISFVSIQMQSIIARVNAESISIDAAAAQLGISMIALTWERSTLVLFLIFMSGFLRDEGKNVARATFSEPLASPLQAVSISASGEDNKPLQIPQVAGSHFASKEQAIWAALAANPHASDEELAAMANTTTRTANKWAAKIRSKAS